MKFISYEGTYFRPEAVAMVSEDQDNEGMCIVHLFGGQKIFLPQPAEFTANFIADVARYLINEGDFTFKGEQG